MELRYLHYFIAVAEELHFGRAATRLNVSQPPLSRQIQQFEEELGIRLFHRTKREVRLTEAGVRVLNEAHHVLGAVEHLKRLAAQDSEGGIGRLSVGVPGGENETVIETLRIFKRRHSQVHIELKHMNTASQIVNLREGRIHVGFLNLPVQDQALSFETVKKGPLWIALPRRHNLASYDRVPVKALRDEDFIMFPRRVNPGLYDVLTGVCRKAGFSLNAVHEVDNIIGSLTLVSADMGVCFCTTSMRKSWTNVVFRPVDSPVQMRLAVAYRRDTHSPTLDAFLKVVRGVARNSFIRQEK